MSAPIRSGTETELARILKERVEQFRVGVDALCREFLKPLPTLQPWEIAPEKDVSDSGFLAESVRSLAGSEDQIALLDHLLEGASRCFSRVCLFIVQEDSARGWSSVGLPEAESGDPAKSLSVDLREESILLEAVESRSVVRRGIAEGRIRFLPSPRPGDRLPETAMAAPILVRDHVAAVLYADDGGDGRHARDAGSVEVLASVTSLVANRLAALSHPEEEAEEEIVSRASVEVRIPAGEEGGGFVSDAAGFTDPLAEDLAPSPEPSAGRLDVPEEEKALHEDARRFARLLISELLLYNEDLVLLGRKRRDIYSRLKEDIDRSRQAYEQRVPRSVSAKTDYFREELVRTLAGGDPTALGPEMAG